MLNNEIIVVSGLPRSGTSMMMQILKAGGLELLVDNIREADDDNQKGYFEFELVKKLPEQNAFLQNAAGKAVKVISELLETLPSRWRYKVIFMQRNMAEILASQKKMLKRRGKSTNAISDEELSSLYKLSLQHTQGWLAHQDNMEVLYIDYNQLMTNPGESLKKLNHFLNSALDLEEMLLVPDQRVYRNRS